MKRRVRLILSFAVSLLFLFLAMRKIQWGELWVLFRGGNYLWLLPALAILVAINWTRAYRWRLLMYPDTHLSLRRTYRFVNIGYLFNNILPAKAGEVVRAYLVGREIKGGLGQALSSLLIERLLDVLTVVVLLAILLPIIDLPDWVRRGGFLFGLAAVAGTVVLLVLSYLGDRGIEWLWRIIGRLPVIGHPKLRQALTDLVHGFDVLRIPRLLPGLIGGSALVWLGYGTFNYVLMQALGLEHLPFGAAALVLCATGFSMVVPSSPGAMGVFEWAAVQALAVFAVGESEAFGYGLGLHVFTNVILILFGLIGLAQENLSWSGLRREAIASTRSGTDTDVPAHEGADPAPSERG